MPSRLLCKRVIHQNCHVLQSETYGFVLSFRCLVLRRDNSKFRQIEHRQAVGTVAKRKPRSPVFIHSQTLGMRAFLQLPEFDQADCLHRDHSSSTTTCRLDDC
jgi:hypothetical protein